jgi:hypothetical protein
MWHTHTRHIDAVSDMTGFSNRGEAAMMDCSTRRPLIRKNNSWQVPTSIDNGRTHTRHYWSRDYHELSTTWQDFSNRAKRHDGLTRLGDRSRKTTLDKYRQVPTSIDVKHTHTRHYWSQIITKIIRHDGIFKPSEAPDGCSTRRPLIRKKALDQVPTKCRQVIMTHSH